MVKFLHTNIVGFCLTNTDKKCTRVIGSASVWKSTKHDCLWTFRLWFDVVIDKSNGFTKYPKSCDYIGIWLYNVDLEIIVLAMLYVFRDDKHKMKIEKPVYIFSDKPTCIYNFFLNSIKGEKTEDALHPNCISF